jgi:hypothetical protein
MAVKFSQFNVASSVSEIDYLVGYKSTDNIQIPVGLVGSNTTYTVATAQAGSNETLTLTGSDSSTDVITFTAGNDITLTDDGAGNGFTIASTASGDTYTLQAGAKAGTSVPLQLDAAAGSDSTVNLTEGTGITLTQTSATEITIDAAGGITRTVDQTTISNATTGSVTLSVSPTSEAYTDMYVSGVYQNKSVYSLSGSTITLDGGAYFPNGSIVEVVSTT